NRCIDTEISRPTCTSGSQSLQDLIQRRSDKRIVQRLLNDNVVVLVDQLGMECPSGRVWLKSIPTLPQCLTQATFPERRRTIAASKLMRSITPCRSYLGSPFSRPTCISTTTISSTGYSLD